MNPLRVGSGFKRGESSNKVIFMACVLLRVLANNCFHYRIQHTMAHLIYPASWVCPVHTLFSPYPENFFLSHYSKWCAKKVTPCYQHRGLRENLQVTANRLKTFSAVQEYKVEVWSLPCSNQADLCCQLLFTEVGNGQKQAPIRN